MILTADKAKNTYDVMFKSWLSRLAIEEATSMCLYEDSPKTVARILKADRKQTVTKED